MKRQHQDIEGNKLFESLKDADPEISQLVESEAERQKTCLNLIASENYTSTAVLEVLGSVLTNKYSEGYPAARHYGGNEFIDQIELKCQQRALKLFHLNPSQWGVNVQSLAGSFANHQVYAALMRPHDRLMGLSLTHGGHMSFGYYQGRIRVSMASILYETMSYDVDTSTGLINYDAMEIMAKKFRPKVIIAGASSYCRHIDFARMKEICTKVGAFLIADIAHTSGLVAANAIPGPFEYADVVTTATQKTLRGPRGSLIFFKKDLEQSVNFSVFPSSQGGPHNHTIAALAVALQQATLPEFQEYQLQLLSNATALEDALLNKGYQLVNGGTDIHMVVVSLIGRGLEGPHVIAACEKAHIALSVTSVPGDTSSVPRAVRLGTTAMTTRGFVEKDFIKAVEIFHNVTTIAAEVKAALPSDANSTRDYKLAIASNEKLSEIAKQVKQWVGDLPLPGVS